ncbi:MAG: hypothetical protein E7254_02930 [Lachnospiraceae bacterium]|nr:hypothetical protein [Lachnospiraceae bacterium]
MNNKIRFIKDSYKLYSIILAVITFVMLTRLIGVKFFILRLENGNNIDINRSNAFIFFVNLTVYVVKTILLVMITFVLKRKKIIESLWIFFDVFVIQVLFISVLYESTTLVEAVHLYCLYLPKCIIVFWGIYIYKKIKVIYEEYKRKTKVVSEIALLAKIMMLIALYSLVFALLWGILIILL